MLPNPRLNILMLLLACIGIFAIEMTSGSTTSLPSPLPSSSPSPIPSSPPSSLLSQPTGRPSKQDHSILGAAQRRSLKYLVVAKRERNLDGADEDLLRDEGIIASVSEVDDTPMTHVSLSFDFLFAGKYVLVAEWGMHRIRVIHVVAKTGELRPALTYGSFGYLDEPGRFNHPRGIAVQQSTGLVVVSDENNHLQVLKFVQHPVPRFTHVSSLGRPSHGAVVSGGQHSGSGGRRDTMGFFNLPTGVVIHDESGLVFVADSKNHRIQTLRLTQDGKLHPISMFGAGGQFTFKAMPEVR